MIFILFWENWLGYTHRKEFDTKEDVLTFLDSENPKQYNLYIGKKVKLKISIADENYL